MTIVTRQRFALSTGVELDVQMGGAQGNPPIFFLHGFPESSRTWRHQLADLSRDFRVVAPDQRGFARSSKPAGVENYTPDKPVADLIALADALGIDRFTLVGHDWGGAIAWMAALGRPDRVERLVIVNAPHPFVFQRSLFDDADQRKASQYITRFRDTGLDKGLVGAGLEKFLGSTFAHHITGTLLDEDKAAYLDEWSQPGAITAMLNWYRASQIVVPASGPASGPAPGEQVARPDFLDRPFPPVTQPTLVIWGMRDVALLPVQLEGLDALVPNLKIVRIADAGHFVTWEKPEPVTAAIREFVGG